MGLIKSIEDCLDYVETDSGLYVPEDCLPERRPKAVDLYCGCGGSSVGIIEAGFEVVAACDYDCSATTTYLVNLGAYPMQFYWIEPEDEQRMEAHLLKDYKRGRKDKIRIPHVAGSGWIAHEPPGTPGVSRFFLGDSRKLKGCDILDAIGLEVGELDLLIGTPPCQGYSHAGKRSVMDPRNSLVFDFARLVCEIQPKTMLFENVPGMTTMVTPEGHNVVDQFCRILQDGGFGTMSRFKQAMESQSGSVGLLRGNSVAKKKKPAADKTKRETQKSFAFTK